MWFDCTKTTLKKLKVAYNFSLRRFMILPWRNSASGMLANLSLPSFDELQKILFLDFDPGLLIQTTCLYQVFIIQLVAFIHICELGGIICYTCFPHRMLTSLHLYSKIR